MVATQIEKRQIRSNPTENIKVKRRKILRIELKAKRIEKNEEKRSMRKQKIEKNTWHQELELWVGKEKKGWEKQNRKKRLIRRNKEVVNK